MRTNPSILGRIGQYLTLAGAATLPFAGGCGYKNFMDDPEFKQELADIQTGVKEKARKVAELVEKYGIEGRDSEGGLNYSLCPKIEVNKGRYLEIEYSPKGFDRKEDELIIRVDDRFDDLSWAKFYFNDTGLDGLNSRKVSTGWQEGMEMSRGKIICDLEEAKMIREMTEEEKKDEKREDSRQYLAALDLALEKLHEQEGIKKDK